MSVLSLKADIRQREWHVRHLRAFLRPLVGFGVDDDADPASLEGLGFGLVRFGTKCFRVFQPRPLSVEDGFKAGNNFLVCKIKTEGSNRN